MPAPSALSPVKNPGTYRIGRWVGLSAGLDVSEDKITLDPIGLRTLTLSPHRPGATPATLTRLRHVRTHNQKLTRKLHAHVFTTSNSITAACVTRLAFAEAQT